MKRLSGAGRADKWAREPVVQLGYTKTDRQDSGRTERRRCNVTKKMTRTRTKAAAPARPKKQIRKKRPKARLLEEQAVIHQDLFFAEAPTEP